MLTTNNILSTPIPVSDVPLLVGYMNRKYGTRGFEKAEIGHPVFEYKDRYVIYLTSESLLVENVNNETVKQKFVVTIPFYKDTLRPCIDFTESATLS